jgi:hypothetical protein
VNSGYYRCFATKKDDALAFQIAEIVSDIHATTISNGNYLDSVILTSPQFNPNKVVKKANSSNIKYDDCIGHYSKFAILKKDCDKIKKTRIETDYVVITEHKVSIYEVKDGDTFDTKKSEGEIESLKIAAGFFQNTFPEKSILYHVVMWNATDIKKTSFKSQDKPDTCLMTGKEFCNVVGCDFDAISSHRREKAQNHKDWMIEQMDKLHESIHKTTQ